MPSTDEPFDASAGLPTLDDYLEAKGQTGGRRAIGRPRKNPLATQRQLRQFQAEYRRRERLKLDNARAERKAEIDDYVDALFAGHPDIQALLISIMNTVMQYAQRDDDPLTEYDARTYVMQTVMRKIKHLTSREETIKFLQAQHETQLLQTEEVTASDEVPVTAAEATDEEFEAMMAAGLPGSDCDDEPEGDGMMTYPDDWKIG